MFAEKYEPVLALLLALKGEPRPQKSGPNFSSISNKENLPGASGFFERGEIALTGGEAALRCFEWSSNMLGPNSQNDSFKCVPLLRLPCRRKLTQKSTNMSLFLGFPHDDSSFASAQNSTSSASAIDNLFSALHRSVLPSHTTMKVGSHTTAPKKAFTVPHYILGSSVYRSRPWSLLRANSAC